MLRVVADEQTSAEPGSSSDERRPAPSSDARSPQEANEGNLERGPTRPTAPAWMTTELPAGVNGRLFQGNYLARIHQ
jgi:hypothetical protein